MSGTWHPDELELADHVLNPAATTPEIAAHIAACAECRDLVSTLHDGPSTPPAPLYTPAQRAERVSVPATVQPGQIWHALWELTHQLVLIAAVSNDQTTLAALPVVDAAGGDDTTVLVAQAVLGWDAAVVTGLAHELPLRVLDTYVTSIPAATLDRIKDARTGAGDLPPITDDTDPRCITLAEVTDRLGDLAAATWMAETTGRTIREILEAAYTSPSAMTAATGIPPKDAMDLLRGKRPPNESERSRLAHAGIDAADADVAVDPLLMWALDQPQTRPSLKAAARRQGRLDDAAYRLHVVMNENFAIAARKTGSDPWARALAVAKEVLDGLN